MKKILFVAVLAAFSGGCATAPSSQIARFAEVGTRYAATLDALLIVARDTAIDKDSAELIDQNSFADRKAPGFAQQETRRLVRQDEQLGRRIAVFRDIARHARVLKRYFTGLNALATSDADAQTLEALKTTAGNLDALTAQLQTQDSFQLPQDAVDRVGTVVQYAIAKQQRAALRAALKRDAPLLRSALQVHRELLAVIGKDLGHDIAVLQQRERQRVLEIPFTAKKPLLESASKSTRWMRERKRILLADAAVAELASAQGAARELQEVLRALVEGESGLYARIDGLLVELESIRNVIQAVQGPEGKNG